MVVYILFMKICFLTTDSKVGGAEKVVLYLAAGLSKLGHQCKVYSFKGGGTLDTECAAIGVESVCYDLKSKFLPGLIKRLAVDLKRDQPDIIQCHLFHANVVGVAAAKLAGIRTVIVTEHGLDEIGGSRRNILRNIYGRMASGILAISESSGNKLKTFPLIPKNKIKVIHNGIPNVKITNKREQNLESIGLTQGHTGLLIGAVSHFRREKGVDITIRAFAQLSEKYPDVKLVLVGSGYQETELRALTSRLGLTHKIIFAGFRPDAVEILSLFDVYVLSSYEEGISITLLEASSLGKASVVSAVGGNPEIVVQGDNGLLVPSGSPGELAREISKLLDDSDLRLKLGQNLKQTYIDRFSVENMVTATEEWFKEVLGAK